MSSMTYQDVDLAEVSDLSAEDVEAREVYAESTVETVNNPLLNFLLEGGEASLVAKQNGQLLLYFPGRQLLLLLDH